MAYFNSQWQSGKLFCCFHFSESSCWPFAPLSTLLNALLMRNISMRIHRELWPVPPTCSWGPLFLLWMWEEHSVSPYWDAWRQPFLYSSNIFSNLICSMWLSHQFVSQFAMSYPNAGHDLASLLVEKSSSILLMITLLHMGSPGRSSVTQYLRAILISILTSPWYSGISLAIIHFIMLLNFIFSLISLFITSGIQILYSQLNLHLPREVSVLLLASLSN